MAARALCRNKQVRQAVTSCRPERKAVAGNSAPLMGNLPRLKAMALRCESSGPRPQELFRALKPQPFGRPMPACTLSATLTPAP